MYIKLGPIYTHPYIFGAIQVLRNADEGGGVTFSGKRYEGVRYNIISITKGWVGGGPISWGKAFFFFFLLLCRAAFDATLEWPLM